jgi:hypothetical protein
MHPAESTIEFDMSAFELIALIGDEEAVFLVDEKVTVLSGIVTGEIDIISMNLNISAQTSHKCKNAINQAHLAHTEGK